ncbi:unnamed protein product [Acanthoscelides obtectus]|uniref:A-kinase anchor protein 2 C-terminal domain-containing protein n=1 Tax=Acanthoscelides obtectus TaxID=200917 RepID=A0A9P0KYM5_ACAOB|nr:unnamed protein product [Acanthoscelides obtectus]CAK1637857.1 hypothetical protein AOBTE_LOCUS10236 [Acanthoscelides obtectus]
MNGTGQTTLDKIQNEIRENLKREDELKSGYRNGVKTVAQEKGTDITSSQSTESTESKPVSKMNGFKKYTPNISKKGVMQRFFKSRGKVGVTSQSTDAHSVWISDATFQPAKITVEKGGKPLRNGYVPAEEKITKELQDFQIREIELRKERFKSQPDLMASLDLEDSELESIVSNGSSILKPAKSMANLYQSEDDEQSEGSSVMGSSAPGSLKPARSLAALCDVSDDEALPDTHSLIMKFEHMKVKNNGCV